MIYYWQEIQLEPFRKMEMPVNLVKVSYKYSLIVRRFSSGSAVRWWFLRVLINLI